MKKKDFKIGDKVIVTESEYNGKGTVVHVTDIDCLIKFDKEIGSFKCSLLSNYESDRKDLWWVALHNIKHIEKSITKKQLLKRIEALEALAVVEKKTELEVGKWYKLTWDGGYVLSVFQGYDVKSYGIHSDNDEWFNEHYWFSNFNTSRLNHIIATSQEVETALIKEAKRRGYKTGCMVKSFVSGITPIEYSEIHYRFDSNTLVMGGAWIFKDGKWAEVIKNADKFAELKEAHKNGSVIQYFSSMCNDWKDIDTPRWTDVDDYRIKPDDKPKVGDVCKFWDDNEHIFVIGVLKEFDDSYQENTGWWYGNAKKLTPDEVTTILFKGKGAK